MMGAIAMERGRANVVDVPRQRCVTPDLELAAERILQLQDRLHRLQQELAEVGAIAEELRRTTGAPATPTFTPLALRRLRHERGWSQGQVIHRLQQLAERRGIWMPARDTIRIYLSRWENGHARPSELYAELLHAVYDCAPACAAS